LFVVLLLTFDLLLLLLPPPLLLLLCSGLCVLRVCGPPGHPSGHQRAAHAGEGSGKCNIKSNGVTRQGQHNDAAGVIPEVINALHMQVGRQTAE
jgi:hypothetical protein